MKASQVSTFQGSNNYGAGRCTDGNVGTLCHTKCGNNVWFKMTLQDVFCIDKVKIVGHKTDGAQYRMNKGKILVLNSKTDDETLCGTLQIRDTPTREGQTYHIQCGKYICGDQVKLSVIRAENEAEGCIIMREITAYYSTGKSTDLLHRTF